MKKIIIIFWFYFLLQIIPFSLRSQDSIYFVQDYPTVRVIPIETEKGVKDQFWYPWIGSVIGALLGFWTAIIVTGFNNRRADRLRRQDFQRDLL